MRLQCTLELGVTLFGIDTHEYSNLWLVSSQKTTPIFVIINGGILKIGHLLKLLEVILFNTVLLLSKHLLLYLNGHIVIDLISKLASFTNQLLDICTLHRDIVLHIILQRFYIVSEIGEHDFGFGEFVNYKITNIKEILRYHFL